MIFKDEGRICVTGQRMKEVLANKQKSSMKPHLLGALKRQFAQEASRRQMCIEFLFADMFDSCIYERLYFYYNICLFMYYHSCFNKKKTPQKCRGREA